MAGRNKLRGIAHGLLGTFVSRNNDVGGYWGLGVLRLLAQQNELPSITIELLDVGGELSSPEPTKFIEQKYRTWLLKALERNGVVRDSVFRAKITVEFLSFEEFPEVGRDTWGEPYRCTVAIVNDREKEFQVSKVGVCAAHDPIHESRSNRF